MATLQPELAAQLRFQASLIRLCGHMNESVRPEQLTPETADQPHAEAIEKLAVLVPVRVAPRRDR